MARLSSAASARLMPHIIKNKITPKSMKETLIDIVNIIDSCAKARKGTGIAPVARVHCLYDNEEKTFWFTNHVVSTYGLGDLSKFGSFVPKNSNVAIKMQTSEVGSSFEYEGSRYKRKVTYHVTLENQSDFQNQTIAIAGDPIRYQYRNIKEFLDALQQNLEDIKDIEAKIAEHKQRIDILKSDKKTAHERGQITKTINELQKEYRILTQQQEDLKNITIYIRKQGEMRYSLIVDTVQTKIKSQNLFDGTTVIIDGGPGTGKSTTMIHRLAYLTDLFALDEDEKNKLGKFKLSSFQRKQLREAIDNQRDWMFFSPSQMLKEYLADAMRKEGLSNTSEKVWFWKEYRQLILQNYYNILESGNNNAPFKFSYQTGTLFYQNSGIINEFTNYYLDQLRDVKAQLPELKSEGQVFAWTAIAKGIKEKFEGCDKFSIGNFVSLFNSLESVYSDDCKSLLRDKNDAINEMTETILKLLEQNSTAKSDIVDLFELTTEVAEYVQEDIEDEETEPKDDVSKEIQKWIKEYSFSKVNEQKQLNEVQQMVSEILLPLIGDEYEKKIRKIGELIEFEQFAKCTRGIKANMLNIIPATYKSFRKYLNRTKYDGCDLVLLRNIIQQKGKEQLHHQEQALLLGFINTVVKQVKASTQSKIKHSYMDAYEEVARPIIGIDEATDFSACDIYAMQSLLTRDFSSLTLCGDMMQRMTTFGIEDWAELDSIVPNPKREVMKTSYRQSKKLLELARKIYEDTRYETPAYKAFMKSNKVPAPLVYVNENEHEKIGWISKRISEVYRAYGEQLPSIAIFVNDKGYIPRFVENLQNTEFLKKNGIKVLDGTKDNKNVENRICVYPIDVVKGMEFDVVFFHNIDNSSANTEILKRYIYVGVSRAAFFLGITLEKEHEITKYFEKNKDWFKI